MADKSWKAFERRIAKLFGCKRRGADFRGEHGGKDDLTHDWYAVEIKLLARPCFSDMLAACKQAEYASVVPGIEQRHPVAIVKRKRDLDSDALVCMRLQTWLDWNLAQCAFCKGTYPVRHDGTYNVCDDCRQVP